METKGLKAQADRTLQPLKNLKEAVISSLDPGLDV